MAAFGRVANFRMTSSKLNVSLAAVVGGWLA